jgi:hypothetical protein
MAAFVYGNLEITRPHICFFSIRLASNRRGHLTTSTFIKSQDKRRADLATKKDKTDPPPTH